jgi:hypothetical protein
MKRIIVLSLVVALTLAACDAMYTPTQEPVQPTAVPPTAEVIVVTVEVPVTVEAPATPVPTATVPPALTEAAPTEAPPTEAVPVDNATSGGPVSVDASLWGKSFKDITYSNPSFSLRCEPTQITFNATANDPAIIAVDFYFRMEDRKGTTITEWKNFGRMEPLGNGNFSLTMLGESIHPDLRMALAWFDFQLVGTNKLGQVVGRTEKIVQSITYTIDCQ